MKTASVLLLCALAGASAAPVLAAPTYSTTQCQSWFKANDLNGDGTLGTKENASKFLSLVTSANDERGEYIMSKAFFMIECKIGSFGSPPA